MGGGRRKGINGRQAGHLYGEEQGTADVSLQRHTQRQQPSTHAHADNEWALAVETRTGRKDDMGRGKESTDWLDSFKPLFRKES